MGKAGPTQPDIAAAPSAAAIAIIPAEVREHALLMHKLDAEVRELREKWYALRARFKRWLVESPDTHPRTDFATHSEVGTLTRCLWERELAQENAATIYRAQLAENDARPIAERWSRAARAAWVKAQTVQCS